MSFGGWREEVEEEGGGWMCGWREGCSRMERRFWA